MTGIEFVRSLHETGRIEFERLIVQRLRRVNAFDQQQFSYTMTPRRLFYEHTFYFTFLLAESPQANHTRWLKVKVRNKQAAVFDVVHCG